MTKSTTANSSATVVELKPGIARQGNEAAEQPSNTATTSAYKWFRLYNDVINDPKVQRLDGETFKAWINILCLASKGGGVLPIWNCHTDG